MNAILDAALHHAENGLPIFPTRGKRPLTEHGFLDATTNADTIREWWMQWPDANVAIPTGPRSGLVVVDIDPRNDGDKSVVSMEQRYGPIPITLESQTPGGGRHLFFALGEGQVIRNSAGKLGPGLDVRGDGGYVVLPPSLHRDTGREYSWTREIKPVPLPNWLLAQLAAPTPKPIEFESSAAIPKGQRNDTLLRIAGAMRRRSCTREAIEAGLLAENEHRCDPPLSEAEVRRIAASVSRYPPTPESKPTSQSQRSGFELTKLGELLSEPEEAVSWLLADRLPSGGISILSAKPKVGKSTFARCLALAVARGEPFLGCHTTQGSVIYLALEEKRSEVRRHFSDLGARDEPIHIHCAAAPRDALLELFRLIRELKPALVIVDPLFKFVRVKDEKAYAEVCQAIEPLLILARETGAHVMLVHHCGKADRADATDAILGSTAIFGGVDSALIMKRTDRYRTLQSSQKYGTDWPETVLEFDSETRALSLGAEKSEADTQAISKAILDHLVSVEGTRTESEIDECVEGKTAVKRKALRMLLGEGKINREGGGKKGDPFKYGCSFPCSQHMAGTREQGYENEVQGIENQRETAVPVAPCDAPNPVATREQEKPFEEGEF